MMDFLVDSNVILDMLTEDPHWFDCSLAQLADCTQIGTLHIGRTLGIMMNLLK